MADNAWSTTVSSVTIPRLLGYTVYFKPYEVFHGALASSVYYLTIAKHSCKNFHATLKNHESLAQWITVSRKIQLATCFPWQPLMPTPPDNDLIYIYIC